MSENVQITPGAGVTIAADGVVDGTLGAASVQYVKIMDGAISGTNKLGVSSAGGLNTTDAPVIPLAAITAAIAVGGTAVTVFTGPINGGYITNPSNSAQQGGGLLSNLYIDMVGTPGSADAAANGTTSVLVPGQTFTFPALANGVTVKANGPTTGQKFTAVRW